MKAAGPLAVAGLLVTACASKDVKEPVDIDRMSFDMAAGANRDRPARLEMVRVNDDDLVRELVGIATEDWFGDAGEAFRSANPNAVYDVWEVVPGRAAGPFKVDAKGDLAAILFCDTQEAPPPLRVGRGGDVTVHVTAGGCEVDGGRGEGLLERLRRRSFVNLFFATSADAGGHRPVRVELVRTPDPELVDELARLDPGRWFADVREDFRRTHRDVLFDDWELVPDGAYGPFGFAVNSRTEGVLFCGGSERPLRIPWEQDIEVHIDGTGCALSSEPGRRGPRWWNPRTWGGSASTGPDRRATREGSSSRWWDPRTWSPWR